MHKKVLLILTLVSLSYAFLFRFFSRFPPNSAKRGMCAELTMTFPCIRCTEDDNCSGNLLCCPVPINTTNANSNCCTPAIRLG